MQVQDPFSLIEPPRDFGGIGTRCTMIMLEEKATAVTTESDLLRCWVRRTGDLAVSNAGYDGWQSLGYNVVSIALPGRRLISSWVGRSENLLVEFDPALIGSAAREAMEASASDVGAHVFIEDSCLAHALLALGEGAFSPASLDRDDATIVSGMIFGRIASLARHRSPRPERSPHLMDGRSPCRN